jgi:hypothetical protein
MVIAVLLCPSVSAAKDFGRFVGTWRGDTKKPSVLLRIVQNGDVLEGTITLFNPDGKSHVSAISHVEVNTKSLNFESADMNFSMTVTDETRAVLRGKQRELDIEFQMIRVVQLSRPNR